MKRALAGRRAARQCREIYELSAEAQKNFALVHALARAHANLGYGAVGGGIDGGVHLHGFKGDEQIAGLDLLALLDVYRHNDRRERTGDVVGACGRGSGLFGRGGRRGGDGRRNRGSGGCGSRRRSDGRDSRAEDFNFDFVRFAFYCYAPLFPKKRFLLIEFNGCVIF